MYVRLLKKWNGTCFIHIFLPVWCHVQRNLEADWLLNHSNQYKGNLGLVAWGGGGIEGVPLDVHDKTPQTLSLDMPSESLGCQVAICFEASFGGYI